MAQITAEMVRKLRERSGLPMMDCKKALEETSGDEQAAMELLRKRGAAAAEKKLLPLRVSESPCQLQPVPALHQLPQPLQEHGHGRSVDHVVVEQEAHAQELPRFETLADDRGLPRDRSESHRQRMDVGQDAPAAPPLRSSRTFRRR